MSHTPGPRIVHRFDEDQVVVLGPGQDDGRRELVGWTYVSWISNPPGSLLLFGELVTRARVSDHGEEREVDIYPEGAVCYFREAIAAAEPED